MADNPRIDELRKRLEREPGSRLFAQLAEELRKDGDLADAIRVCREGLQKHPQYPSARMTLGRALFDTGDLAAARTEFQAVLKGAPDNILAARLLGESLEGLEDWLAAAAQYKRALMMAPGDKQLQAHLEAVENRIREPEPEAARHDEAEPAPIKVLTVDEPMELERPFESRATQVGEAPEPPEFTGTMAIPVAQVEEDFEIERPVEAPSVSLKPAPPPPPPVRIAPPPPEEVVEFDEAPTMPGTLPATPDIEYEPTTLPPQAVVDAAPREVAPEAPFVASEPSIAEPAPLIDVEPEAPSEEIASVTLADLYSRQGFNDKAAQVLEQLLLREPGNERAQARLREIRSSAAGAMPPPADATDAKRVVIQRTIDRLEAMLAAIRKG